MPLRQRQKIQEVLRRYWLEVDGGPRPFTVRTVRGREVSSPHSPESVSHIFDTMNA
jgi:hypothetical protein